MLIYLSLIKEPDERAKFRLLYDTHHRFMLHMAYCILNNQQDAEDAVHEAFLRLTEIIEKIHDPTCPKTRRLVGMIVRGKAIDLYRRRRRGRLIDLDDTDRLFAPGPTLVQRAEEADGVLRAMAALGERDRDLLLLRYDQGFSPKEVARLTGMTEAGVKKALQRAKVRLKECLEKEGIEV